MKVNQTYEVVVKFSHVADASRFILLLLNGAFTPDQCKLITRKKSEDRKIKGTRLSQEAIIRAFSDGQIFNVSDVQRALLSSGISMGNVYPLCTSLRKEGLIENVNRGVFKLTEKAEKLLQSAQ
jgi:hypothetical protein